MNNKVLFPPKSRQIFKAIFWLSVLLAVIFGIALYTIVRLDDTNLDGKVVHVTGTCTAFDDEGLHVSVNGEDKVFKEGPLRMTLISNGILNDENADDYFKSLVDKQLSFCIPQNPFEDNILWMLSLTVDGTDVATTEEVFAREEEENRILRIVFTSVIAAFAAAACVSMILKVNTPALKEYDLTNKFAEHFADKQPLPSRKKMLIALVIALLLFIVCFTAVGICSELFPDADETIFIVAFIAAAILPYSVPVVCAVRLKKTDLEYYDTQFPFDFCDAKNYPTVGKKDREAFQNELNRFKEENPDTYADGGNLYNVKFTEKELQLYDMFEEESEDEYDVDNIFAANREQQAAFSIPYDKLNLQAVAYYGLKGRPLTVVIRTRLQPDPSYPEQFTNDIHLLLEKDLLDTLQKFKIQVEGLTEILQNKAELMANRFIRRQKS